MLVGGGPGGAGGPDESELLQDNGKLFYQPAHLKLLTPPPPYTPPPPHTHTYPSQSPHLSYTQHPQAMMTFPGKLLFFVIGEMWGVGGWGGVRGGVITICDCCREAVPVTVTPPSTIVSSAQNLPKPILIKSPQRFSRQIPLAADDKKCNKTPVKRGFKPDRRPHTLPKDFRFKHSQDHFAALLKSSHLGGKSAADDNH